MSGSAEELAMRGAVEAWGRVRWPGCRVMHELQVGGCRIDLAFVTETNIAGVEIKSSRDTLKRLDRQIEHYTAGLPEVWLAFAPKWLPHIRDHNRLPWSVGKVMVDHTVLLEEIPWQEWSKHAYPAKRDMVFTSPLLYLLLKTELLKLATHRGVSHKSKITCTQLIERLARSLTGDEIVTGVCALLRQRYNNWQADAPMDIAA